MDSLELWLPSRSTGVQPSKSICKTSGNCILWDISHLQLVEVCICCVMSSAAVLGYALESFVDVWSSLLVLWRFWDDRSTDVSGMALQREKYASFGISVSVRV